MVTESSFPSGLAINRSFAPLLFCRKLLLLIARLDAAVLGQNPNLEQMGRIRLGGIRLTVANPGARAHTLSITGTNYRAVSHAVLVFERAFKQIGDDLHIAMRMRGKTMAGCTQSSLMTRRERNPM